MIYIKLSELYCYQGLKFIQPEVPASYKPQARYTRPVYPLESGTIYNLSYPGVEGDIMKNCRPGNAKAPDNIRPSTMPISQDTTFRLSFTGVCGERAISYKPAYRNMMGTGAIQSMTTQRHDFTPKPLDRALPIPERTNIHLSKARMESK